MFIMDMEFFLVEVVFSVSKKKKKSKLISLTTAFIAFVQKYPFFQYTANPGIYVLY